VWEGLYNAWPERTEA